jgi:T5SS/PEP-CTERM-associated repeat protein
MRGNRLLSRLGILSLVVAGALAACPFAQAANIGWDNPAGGSFHVAGNWNPSVIPGSVDSAFFNLDDPGYTVTLISNVTNAHFQVQRDVVTLSLGPTTYSLTNIESLYVAANPGQDGRLTLSGGTLSTVNTRIGGAGTGFIQQNSNNVWNSSGILFVGPDSGGPGSLTILGDLTTSSLSVGGGGNGTALVRNSGATLTINSGFTVGHLGGTGTFSVENGADVTGGITELGSGAGSNGTVIVTGSSSTLALGALTVGRDARGVLTVEEDGALTSTSGNLASLQGSSATVSITDGGAWNSSGSLSIGSNGSATVTISSGGELTNTSATIGGNPTGSGSVTVNGTGSRWTSSTSLGVGFQGVGTVSIQNGGTVEAQSMNIGDRLNSRGTVTLSGATSNLDVSVNMHVGGSAGGAGGSGTLNINPGTSVTVGATLRLWPAGTINLSGGSLSASLFTNSGGTLNFSSGTLNQTGSTLNVSSTGILGSVVQLNADQHVTAQAVSVDAAGLLMLNGGTVAVTGATSAFFNGGEVQLHGGTSLISGRPMNNGGLLTGSGRITSSTFTNQSAGEVRVSGSERLFFGGAGINLGQINLLNGGTAEFGGGLSNQATGRINGRGVLIARGGIFNDGQMSFSGGFTDVFGSLTNNSGARIISTGGGVTTFYNAITHSAGADIRASVGSMVIFLGNVTGTGTYSGAGTLVFETTNTVIGPVVTDGATIVEADASVTAHHFRQKSLTVNGVTSIASGGGTSHLNSLQLSDEGVLDLNNNSLVLEGGDLAEVTALIRSGLYEGKGITSSAPGSPFRLGSMLNTGTFHSSFMGIGGLDGDEVLIRYTRIGDLNLDGTVTISDFIDLASHFNMASGVTWQDGDVNYDGSVSISDFIDLAANFNTSISGATMPWNGSDLAMVNEFAASIGAAAVPEPGAMAALATGLLLLCGRRNKALSIKIPRMTSLLSAKSCG